MDEAHAPRQIMAELRAPMMAPRLFVEFAENWMDRLLAHVGLAYVAHADLERGGGDEPLSAASESSGYFIPAHLIEEAFFMLPELPEGQWELGTGMDTDDVIRGANTVRFTMRMILGTPAGQAGAPRKMQPTDIAYLLSAVRNFGRGTSGLSAYIKGLRSSTASAGREIPILIANACLRLAADLRSRATPPDQNHSAASGLVDLFLAAFDEAFAADAEEELNVDDDEVMSMFEAIHGTDTEIGGVEHAA